MDGWNTGFLLGWPIFRGHASFRECIHRCLLHMHAHINIPVFTEEVCFGDRLWTKITYPGITFPRDWERVTYQIAIDVFNHNIFNQLQHINKWTWLSIPSVSTGWQLFGEARPLLPFASSWVLHHRPWRRRRDRLLSKGIPEGNFREIQVGEIFLHIHKYIITHSHIFIYDSYIYIYNIFIQTHIFAYTHVTCTYACMYTHIYTYISIYIYVHACISLHFRKLLLKQHDHHDHVAAIGDELVFHDLEGLESQCWLGLRWEFLVNPTSLL